MHAMIGHSASRSASVQAESRTKVYDIALLHQGTAWTHHASLHPQENGKHHLPSPTSPDAASFEVASACLKDRRRFEHAHAHAESEEYQRD
jgi:hypothetical protein